MLAKRIVPCLDVRGGRTVKGTRFVDLKDAGDPAELAERYCAEGADEIAMLDVSATLQERLAATRTVRSVAEVVDIPLTVGGGVRSLEDIESLLKAGADKVAINSAAVQHPELIGEAALAFGSQCVVVAIDAQRHKRSWRVKTRSATAATALDAVDWAVAAAQRGAGEILLTSIDADGTKSGFDVELTKAVTSAVNVPVIASGGASSIDSFADVLVRGGADAALAASVFHYGELSIGELKDGLARYGIEVRR